MPFTVFHLDGERGLRGGERQLLYLASYLKTRGHRNIVVCRGDSDLEKEAKDRGLETMTLPFYCEWDLVSAWKLRGAVAGHRRAILHAHTGHAAALAYLAAIGTDSLRVAHRRVDFPVSSGISLRMKYASADRVIAITEEVRRVLVESGLDAQRVAVVPSSIGPEVAAAAGMLDREECRRRLAEELGLPRDAPWVGMLGALVPHKDPASFLRAAEGVLARRPDARFLLAGSGPLEESLRYQAREAGILDRVRFLGWRTDNLRIIKALDVFVLSSRQEGMGSVLLEALACGTPIAATRAGGIPEAVEDGKSALLCAPGDNEALAGGILDLLARPEKARRLAEEGLKRVKAFGAERMGERVEVVYAGLLTDEDHG